MKAWVWALARRLDGLTLRERALVGLAAALALGLSLHGLLIAPTERALRQEREGLAAARARLAALQAQLDQVRAGLAADPEAELRAQLEALREQIRSADARLEQASVQLITPEQMVRVLQDLIRQNRSLTLVSVVSEPARPLTVEGAAAEAAGRQEGDAPTVFRHDLRIEFRGDYLSALEYLRAVEALPWRIFWDRIEMRVEDYPQVHIRLRTHTLSLEEGWLGV